ncbi:MAG: MazG nucleotide pyrophosphohydrolase domain-containing protein [Candidatus Paceibacterota bacterium]
MKMKNLLKFIRSEHERLMDFYEFDDGEDLKSPLALKVMEELGELYEEILIDQGLQRSEKLREGDVGEEFADVLITILLLAENMEIDVTKELEDKIEKIKNRDY